MKGDGMKRDGAGSGTAPMVGEAVKTSDLILERMRILSQTLGAIRECTINLAGDQRDEEDCKSQEPSNYGEDLIIKLDNLQESANYIRQELENFI